jgi:hypothetical protein
MVSIASKNIVDSATAERVAEAVRDVPIVDFKAWGKLDALSSQTLVDEIEVFEDEIYRDGTVLKGICNFYVVLNYGQGDEAISSPESFPGTFEAKLDDNGDPVILDIDVDTSSFYG